MKLNSYVVPYWKSYVVTILEMVCCTAWEVVCFYDIGNCMLNNGESRTGCLYVITKLEIVFCTMWEVVCFYDIENRMLNNGVSRMLLRYWKSYVVPCGKSYVVTKLEIVC